MPEVTQIEYKSTIYDIRDANATAELEELLSGGNLFKRLANYFFPIGFVMVRYDNQSPTEIYGGIWTAVKEGVLRVTNTPSKVQSVEGNDTTKITVNQLPSHNHPFTQPKINGKFGAIAAAGNNLFSFWETQPGVNSTTFYATDGSVGYTGNGEDFSLMQKSVNIRAWVRVGLYKG